LVWASLAQQKIKGQQSLPPFEVVLDYFPPGHRLLTYSAGSESTFAGGGKRAATLTLWEVLPTDKQVKPVVRWSVPSDEHGNDVVWARLVNKDIVIQRTAQHDLVAWDTAAKKMAYRTKEQSFFGRTPTLSGGRKYLFIPEDSHVRVLESASGNTVMSLPANQAAAVAISDDGIRAAVINNSTLTIWNLADPTAKPQTCRADTISSSADTTLEWVDAERLMAGGSFGHLDLFSIPHQRVIWNYRFVMAGGHARSRQGRTHAIVAGHLAYAAAVNPVLDEMLRESAAGERRAPRIPFGAMENMENRRQKLVVIGAAKLPGAKVDETVASLDPESLLILKPGMSVRLEVNAGADNQRVQAALERVIQKNNWKIDSAASVVVVAEMTRGEPQQITYVPEHLPFRSEGQTVTVTPEISRVSVRVNNKIAWSAGTASGAPPRLNLRAGETVQQMAANWQKPNPAFFDSVQIPDRIYDPEKRNGLGTSGITTRGLMPKLAGER
jgi:hypothetical protein